MQGDAAPLSDSREREVEIYDARFHTELAALLNDGFIVAKAEETLILCNVPQFDR